MSVSLEPYGIRPRLASLRGIPSLHDGDVLDDDEDATQESWHVQLATDDVKVMTLEQLDDAYRLDIVNAQTLVWNADLPSWQPLGVVAGLEEEPAPATIPPPPVLPRTSFPPPPALKPIVAPAAAKPVQSIPHPATAAPASVQPLSSSFAPLAAPKPLPEFAATANARVPAAVPPSVAPVAYALEDEASPFAPKRSRAGGWMLACAFLAGTLVTLYRNDVLLELARNWNYEDQFLSAERSVLGGPSAGTPRALESLLVAEPPVDPTASQQRPNRDAEVSTATPPSTAATPPSTDEAAAADDQNPEADEEAGSAQANTSEAQAAAKTPTRAPVRKPAPRAASKQPPPARQAAAPSETEDRAQPEKPASLKAAMAAAIGSKSGSKPAKPARAARKPARSKPRSKSKATSGKNGEFDPLNGSL